MTRYVSAADTAKLIRRDLKAAYPDVKFSVRLHNSSIRVEWTNGPISVSEIVDRYEGRTFDAMIDLASPRYTVDETGEEVHYGAHYVFQTRNFSEELLQGVADYLTRRYAFTEDPQFEVIPADQYSGAHIRTNNRASRFGNEWASDFFYRFCHKTATDELLALRAQS
jgi:hypothetical protein